MIFLRHQTYLFVFILTILVLTGCVEKSTDSSLASDSVKNRFNVIMISVDTLRADRLGCYGYDLPTSPFLDAFSRRSVLMTDVLAQNPATILSHRAIFTGLYVYQQSIGPAQPSTTLAGRLAEAGYATAAFTDGGLMNAQFGNKPGFQMYNDDAGGAASVFARGLEWIDRQAGQPLFLFLHTYDVHYPYTPLHPYDNMFLPDGTPPYHLGSDYGHEYWNRLSLERESFIWISRRYDGGIRSVDAELMRLWSHLQDRALLESTVVIVVSDHGESLGERQFVGHHELYDVQLQVPVLIHLPRREPWILDGAFETIDILPSILDIVSVPYHNDLPGHSIVDAVRKRLNMTHMRPRLSETWARAFRLGPDRKFILRGSADADEVYYRDSDPEELRNVAGDDPKSTEQLRNALMEFTGSSAEDVRKGRKQKEMPVLLMNKDGAADESKLLNQLRELGYMQ